MTFVLDDTGTIPSFEKITNLWGLYLDNNKLTGECYCFEVLGGERGERRWIGGGRLGGTGFVLFF